MLAAVALWSLAPTVTLRIAATPTPEIVKQVAAATGRKLECSKGLEKDYLCVAVKDAEAPELLSHIAQACEGKWQAEGETLRLIPDHLASSRTRRQALADSIEAAYAKDLERPDKLASLDQLTAKWDKSDAYAKSGSFYEVGSELVYRFVRTLGARYFAHLDSPSYVVFADTPTPFQRPTPLAGVDQWVAEWARQNNWYSSYRQTFPPDPKDNDPKEVEYRRVAQAYGFDDLRDIFKPIEAVPPFRTLFVVQTSGSGRYRSCDVKVRVFDHRGLQVLNGSSALTARLSPVADYDVLQAADEKEIRLSGQSLRHVNAVRSHRLSLAVDRSDAQWVGDLVAHEPLAAVPTDFFFAMADREGKNVVASLPDELIDLTLSTMKGELSYPRLAQAYFNAKDTFNLDAMRLSRDGDWWVATPRDPETARADRIDRAAATRDLLQMATADWPSLDAFATMWAAQPRAACYTLYRLARPVLGDRLDAVDIWGDGLAWIRLWGQLGPEARTRLRLGQDVRIPGRSIAWSESVARLLSPWRVLVPLTRSSPALDPPYLETFARSLGRSDRGLQSRLEDEPTESWMGLLDTSLVLACRPSEGTYFLTVGTKGRETAFGEALDVGQLAYAYTIKELATGQDSDIASMLVTPKRRMQAGRRSVFSLWLGVQGRKGVEGVFNDNRKPIGPVYTLDTLPLDVKAEVERQSKALLESEILLRNDFFFQVLKSGKTNNQTPPPCAHATFTSTAN